MFAVRCIARCTAMPAGKALYGWFITLLCQGAEKPPESFPLNTDVPSWVILPDIFYITVQSGSWSSGKPSPSPGLPAVLSQADPGHLREPEHQAKFRTDLLRSLQVFPFMAISLGRGWFILAANVRILRWALEPNTMRGEGLSRQLPRCAGSNAAPKVLAGSCFLQASESPGISCHRQDRFKPEKLQNN